MCDSIAGADRLIANAIAVTVRIAIQIVDL